ncbi:hypothetical protein DL769_002922 [Monosporascus sp. CRB-8-3]|nr:hypothetical protein DL769_002922 [Monosporascus sp. CRB-8-3]
MDPLSVSASIVGLLAAVGKVGHLLEYVSAVKNAPATLKEAQVEVKHVKIALSCLQRYLDQLDHVSEQRRGLIRVDELIIILADAMMAFSEFESLLTTLIGLTRVRTALLWYRYTRQIDDHISRMSRHKTSLILIRTILQSESDLEALQSQVSLQALVEKVLAENKTLKTRMEQLEDTFDAQSTIIRRRDDDNDDGTSTTRMMDDDSTSVIIHGCHSSTASIPGSRISSLKLSFENVLEQSWVYRRNKRDECDCSFVSATRRSYAWSVFSAYSLADISILSVIAMPITALDISNARDYDPGLNKCDGEEQAKSRSHSNVRDARVLDVRESKEGILESPAEVPGGHLMEHHPQSDTFEAQESIEEPLIKKGTLPQWQDDRDTEPESYSESSNSTSQEEFYSCKECGEILEEGKYIELGKESQNPLYMEQTDII